jgi:hypothetical protein
MGGGLWEGGYGRVRGGCWLWGRGGGNRKIKLSIDPLFCFVQFVAGISFLKTPKRALSTLCFSNKNCLTYG